MTDDNYIGLLGKSALKTKLVAGPKTLPMDEWYKFAGEIIKLLNMNGENNENRPK